MIVEQLRKHAEYWLQGISHESDVIVESLFRMGAFFAYKRRDGLVLWRLAELLDVDSKDLDELVALGPKVIRRWLRILKKPPEFWWDTREYLFGEVRQIVRDLKSALKTIRSVELETAHPLGDNGISEERLL